MFSFFQPTKRYRDERFWRRRARKLFPEVKGAYLRRAELSLPAYFPGHETAYRRSVAGDPQEMAQHIEQTRKSLADLLHVQPYTIYFTENTTQAMELALRHLVAQGYLKPDDEILTTTEEYGSITAALERVAHVGYVTPDELSHAILPETKVIAVSSVTHATCRVLPIEDIVRAGNEQGIITIVDAAQAVGQMPVDVQKLGADVVIGCGHKWLSGD